MQADSDVLDDDLKHKSLDTLKQENIILKEKYKQKRQTLMDIQLDYKQWEKIKTHC
jgi:hypothetical protein